MDGAPAEVFDLFRMAEGEVARDVGVAGVCAGGGVACGEGGGHLLVGDLAGEAAIALAVVAAVPVFEGQPDFSLDIGVGRGFAGDLDAAEGGEGRDAGGGELGSGNVCGRGKDGGSGDDGVIEGEGGESGARGLGGGGGRGQDEEEWESSHVWPRGEGSRRSGDEVRNTRGVEGTKEDKANRRGR